ncbi:MAG: winged helix-turn-helix transcriptional regulator [Clostridia bacterium]|nr:winged helix-turn-helix transcriptional regulator [Clostridia bacterium]
MVSRYERFALAIAEIQRYLHKIASDEMEKYGLKGPYAIYLVTIYRFKDGITSAQLCELCSKNKADVSRAVSAMEKKKLIVRETENTHLYRAKLYLTEAGKQAAEAISRRAQVAVQIAGNGLTNRQSHTFYKTLDIIAANLHALSQEGLPDEHAVDGNVPHMKPKS